MELLDYDPLTGVSLYMDYRSDQDITFRHEQDVSAILDRNKALANDADLTRRGIKEDMWLYASIPAVVQMEWLQKHGVDVFNPEHEKAMFRLLNQPEYQYLRTTHLRHS